VTERAGELDFPGSVLDFLEGLMGQPYGGFPEPLRTNILRGRREKLTERPGKSLKPLDLDKIKEELTERFGNSSDLDVASYTMFPKVYEDYRAFVEQYGDLSILPTRLFLAKPEVGEEVQVEIERGKVLILKLLAVGPVGEKGTREVFFEMNGEVRAVAVDDKKAAVETITRVKADPSKPGDVGAPMSGVVVEIRVKQGSVVKKGDPIAVLSAMKMEMVISSPFAGNVESVEVNQGDSVNSQDLVAKISK